MKRVLSHPEEKEKEQQNRKEPNAQFQADRRPADATDSRSQEVLGSIPSQNTGSGGQRGYRQIEITNLCATKSKSRGMSEGMR
jgi:hypothetical protein